MKFQLSIIEKRAISSSRLKKRLNLNKKLGTKDLTKWLFKRYDIRKDDFILELGCGIGSHVIKQSNIVGKKGFILATDYSRDSLNTLKNNLKNRNVNIKCISMDEVPIFLKNKKIKFDKIISSYALYYAKNPIRVIKRLSQFLKKKGKFLITAPCYPHTLTEFAKKQKTLKRTAENYIDFSTKKLEPFIKKNRIKNKKYNFRNILKFKKSDDLLDFYRSTVFYDNKSEKNLISLFNTTKKKLGYFNIIKSAKLYKFTVK